MNRTGWITMKSAIGLLNYELYDSIEVSGGNWIIDSIDRVGRNPITHISAQAPIELRVPILLNSWDATTDSGVDMNPSLSQLYRLVSNKNKFGAATYNPVELGGVGLPPIPSKSYSNTSFLITDISVDNSSIIKHDDGRLLRCNIDVSLIEYQKAIAVTANLQNIKRNSSTNIAKSNNKITVKISKGDFPAKVWNRFDKKYEKQIREWFRKQGITNKAGIDKFLNGRNSAFVKIVV